MKHLLIFITMFCFASLKSEVYNNFKSVEKNEAHLEEPAVIINNDVTKKVYLESNQIEELDDGFLIRFDEDNLWRVPQLYYDKEGVYCEILQTKKKNSAIKASLRNF